MVTTIESSPAAAADANATRFDPPPAAAVLAMRVELARIAATGGPIFVGPWLSEVGYEILYWVPFLRWALIEAGIAPDRVTVISRGSVKSWYRGLAANYIDIFDRLTPDEFRVLNEARWDETGVQKHMTFSAFDRLILEKLGVPAEAVVLHPAVMYNLLDEYWTGTAGFSRFTDHVVLKRMKPPEHKVLLRLPENFTAVKFYSRPSLPLNDENLAFVERYTLDLAERGPVVFMNTNMAVDDHRDFVPPKHPNIVRIQSQLKPETNLLVQSAIVGRAREVHCTYGGFAYLPLCYGVPAIGVFSHDRHFMKIHGRAAYLLASKTKTPLSVVHAAPLHEGALTAARRVKRIRRSLDRSEQERAEAVLAMEAQTVRTAEAETQRTAAALEAERLAGQLAETQASQAAAAHTSAQLAQLTDKVRVKDELTSVLHAKLAQAREIVAQSRAEIIELRARLKQAAALEAERVDGWSPKAQASAADVSARLALLTEKLRAKGEQAVQLQEKLIQGRDIQAQSRAETATLRAQLKQAEEERRKLLAAAEKAAVIADRKETAFAAKLSSTNAKVAASNAKVTAAKVKAAGSNAKLDAAKLDLASFRARIAEQDARHTAIKAELKNLSARTKQAEIDLSRANKAMAAGSVAWTEEAIEAWRDRHASAAALPSDSNDAWLATLGGEMPTLASDQKPATAEAVTVSLLRTAMGTEPASRDLAAAVGKQEARTAWASAADLMRAGDIPAALGMFWSAIPFAPGDAGLWAALARVARLAGQPALADAASLRAVSLGPTSGQAHATRAEVLIALGRDGPAAAHVAVAVELGGDSARTATRVLAQCLEAETAEGRTGPFDIAAPLRAVAARGDGDAVVASLTRALSDTRDPRLQTMLIDAALAAPDGKKAGRSKKANHLPLALISQVQRSGGTLLAQLFDGHPRLEVHPHEMHIGFPNKWDWPELDLSAAPAVWLNQLFETPLTAFLVKGYAKSDGNVHALEERHPFTFSVKRLAKSFVRLAKDAKTQRAVEDAYMTAFFDAWDDAKTPHAEWVVAFCPRVIMVPDSVRRFYADYTDGALISCIRNPISWFVSSSRHTAEYASLDQALPLWMESTRAALELKQAGARIELLTYDGLVSDTESVMKRACGTLGVDFDPILLKPTYARAPILPNSSFAIAEHGVHKRSLDQHDLLSAEDLATLTKVAMPLYDEARRIIEAKTPAAKRSRA
jgi:hypothetical protein